jgi:hypothetical protein
VTKGSRTIIPPGVWRVDQEAPGSFHEKAGLSQEQNQRALGGDSVEPVQRAPAIACWRKDLKASRSGPVSGRHLPFGDCSDHFVMRFQQRRWRVSWSKIELRQRIPLDPPHEYHLRDFVAAQTIGNHHGYDQPCVFIDHREAIALRFVLAALRSAAAQGIAGLEVSRAPRRTR